ncbi:MAG: hypothetical protein ACOCVM_01710 [Desulfovibrionaceae bacterium]
MHCHDWPGNVRELFNVLELALTANPGADVLKPVHLPTHIRIKAAQARVQDRDGEDLPNLESRLLESEELPGWAEFKERAASQAERAYLVRLLSETGGDMDRAEEVSGLSRSRFYTLLRKHVIKPGG